MSAILQRISELAVVSPPFVFCHVDLPWAPSYGGLVKKRYKIILFCTYTLVWQINMKNMKRGGGIQNNLEIYRNLKGTVRNTRLRYQKAYIAHPDLWTTKEVRQIGHSVWHFRRNFASPSPSPDRDKSTEFRSIDHIIFFITFIIFRYF